MNGSADGDLRRASLHRHWPRIPGTCRMPLSGRDAMAPLQQLAPTSGAQRKPFCPWHVAAHSVGWFASGRTVPAGAGLGNRPLLGAVLLTFGLQMATIYAPPLNPVFKTQPLTLVELLICLGAACAVFCS